MKSIIIEGVGIELEGGDEKDKKYDMRYAPSEISPKTKSLLKDLGRKLAQFKPLIGYIHMGFSGENEREIIGKIERLIKKIDKKR